MILIQAQTISLNWSDTTNALPSYHGNERGFYSRKRFCFNKLMLCDKCGFILALS